MPSETNYYYSAYGLIFLTDVEMQVLNPDDHSGGAHLALLSKSGLSDLRYRFRVPFPASHGREVLLHSNSNEKELKDGQCWSLEVAGVVHFHWEAGSNQIHYQLCDGANDSLLSFWFLHHVLPMYLAAENKYEFLHAAAVEVEGWAVILIAPSGGGKSTLADYFIKKGHALISDDKLAVYQEQERFFVMPSHLRHRPYRSFEDLGVQAKNFARKALPISKIYSISRESTVSDVNLNEVSGAEKLRIVSPNFMYSFKHRATEQFLMRCRLLNTVPVFSVESPDGLDRLHETYEAICRDLSKG